MHTCNDCGVELIESNWSPSAERDGHYRCRACEVKRVAAYTALNKAKRKQYFAEYYQRHKAKINRQATDWQKTHPEKVRNINRRHHQKHIEKRNAQSLQRHHTVRREVLAAYGHACACCGETRAEFLTVDHINRDGASHRREIGGAGTVIYFWLRKNGCPQDGRFRLLCWNCNSAHGFYGYCPHERERAAGNLAHQSS